MSGFGSGLNSIRWRFTLAAGLLALCGGAVRDHWLGAQPAWTAESLFSLALLVLGTAAATYWMADRLTGLIRQLQRSTEAIAQGHLEDPVEVDCACEIGGLAESFRKMRSRLNANVARINTLAYTDGITALPNRAAIDHLLQYALTGPQAGQFRAALLFIDLDGFKRVNDTLGHDGGDILLRLASRRILEQGLGRDMESIDACLDGLGMPCNRLPRDLVFARFAGDEFIAILPGVTDRRELARVGEAIVASLQLPFEVKDNEVNIGASIGIAITPEDCSTAEQLVTFADLAMYNAKQAGKGRCRFFDQQVHQQLLERNRLEADLRQALLRGELLLHYQPQLQARPGRRGQRPAVVGLEALVRWNHPTRGLLMPGAFIDVAEQAGLMGVLGQQVLQLAVQQAQQWLCSGRPQVVSVNVSPSQFTDPGFAAGVLATLQACELPSRWLSIEITESIAMSDFESTARRLNLLREAGVKVSIDDFGIGFSNLSQLSRLPIDQLKIDRSLTQDIGRNCKSEAIIRAIVGMAQALEFRTLAEGIETREQLDFLGEIGCDAVQGYLLGRPMAVEQVDPWLAGQEPAQDGGRVNAPEGACVA